MPPSRALALLCLSPCIAFSVSAHPQVPVEYAPPATTSILPANPHAKEPGLLFYLSGDNGLNADYAAGGNPVPNFFKDLKILPGGVKGSYIQSCTLSATMSPPIRVDTKEFAV